MNPDVEEIKQLMLSKVDEHIEFFRNKFNEESSLLEFELQIRKDINEYGRILFEKLFPTIFGDGYFGSKVEEIDKESQEKDTFSCVIRSHKRELKTIFGPINIVRAYYQHDQTGSSLGLLDRKLGFHNTKVSPAVKYYSNLLGINTSFSEGESLFEKFMGAKVSGRDINRFTEEKAVEVVEHFEKRIADITLDQQGKVPTANINVDEKSERIVYLETDGCFVPIRKFKSEDGDWKECKTLLLFEVEKKKVEKGNKTEIKEEVINKKHFSTVRGINYFKKQVKCELEEYCKDEKIKIVCIGDGAGWIWNMAAELIPEGRVEILDWYHVKEKITLLAAELFPKDKQETNKEVFVETMKGYFYEGKFNKGIELLKEKYKQTKSRELQGKIYEMIGYFENNKERMRYVEYRKQDLSIGSGAIESTNKNVIQRRIKLPGCRWDQENADNMAHMRAEYYNENIDQWFGLESNPMLAIA